MAEQPNRKLVMMPLAELKRHPEQDHYFRELADQELRVLADDMDTNGQTTSVEICSDGTIICGHQRVRAAKLLGWTKIRCWIRHDLEAQGKNAVERRLVQDNVGRRQLTKLERAHAFRRLKQGFVPVPGEGDLRDQLGKLLGVSGKTLERLEKVLDLPVELRNAFDDGKISATEAYRMCAVVDYMQTDAGERIRLGEDPKKVVNELITPPRAKPKSPRTAYRRLEQALSDAMDFYESWGEYHAYGSDVDFLERSKKLVDSLLQAAKYDAKQNPPKSREESLAHLSLLASQLRTK